MHAAFTGQQVASLAQLRRAGQRPAVALTARRLDVLGGKSRLLPGQRAVVRLGHRGGRALPAMADRAPELIELVRDHGMRAERLVGNVGKSGFFEPDVATGAAVDNAQFGQPHLLDSAPEVALQSVGIAAVANHTEIAVLGVPPLAEEILGGSNGQRRQEDEADLHGRVCSVPEYPLPERRKLFFHERRILMSILVDIVMNVSVFNMSINACISSATARRIPSPVRGRMFRSRSAPPVRIKTRSLPSKTAAFRPGSGGRRKATAESFAPPRA